MNFTSLRLNKNKRRRCT